MSTDTMHPMRSTIGLSAALATPFAPDGAIDWLRFAAHVKLLLSSGMNVVTAFGTTGEGASIGATERRALYERMAGEGVEPGRLVEAVYGPSVAEAASGIRHAIGAGAAGILLVPPFYFKNVPEDGLFRWHAELFEAAGPHCRNVILYNIPALTGITVTASLTGRLRKAFPEVIAGVKDSSGDKAHTMSLLAEHRDLAILVGDESYLAEAVRNGASGAISGIANIAPDLVGALVSGVDDERIDEILRVVLAHPVVPAIKALLAAKTGDEEWRRLRAPLEPLREADVAYPEIAAFLH